jgi:hypothetical protein
MGDSATRADERTITTHDLVVRSARHGLDRQRADGSFPPGRNYTYDERETPVRTTTQWLRTLTKAVELTDEDEFVDAANRAVDYLLSDAPRPAGYTYYCRDAEDKDHCNGLVGQAAVIRALACASTLIDRPDARKRAFELFHLHPFDDNLGLWERVAVDGRKLSFDRTLNHQLLFAGAASRLVAHSSTVRDRIECHLDAFDVNARTREDGLIRHYVRPPLPTVVRAVVSHPRHKVLLRNEVAARYFSLSAERRKQERGYQAVNLAGLTEIRAALPSHPVWESEMFRESLAYLRTHEADLIDGVDMKRGTPLQGVSIAIILHRLGETSHDHLRELIRADLAADPLDNLDPFKPLNVDDETAAALVCELAELPEIDLFG